ncbi:carbonic anhydrase family protein [Waterburya agarophytonicola K14]|uniref:Carbonic anhydrase n=1 Tax=Waterburya agarophytonicola KI4 TaxID=2874699 RepID=A0A964FF33_9CYAN|nr:carbonic anhydrase family protein [Waterburya agarophytonicola KI4]
MRPSIWSYQGDTGSSFWGELDPEFATCKVGKAQSPINLPSSVSSSFGSLELSYKDTPLTIVNNHRTIRVDYQPGSNLTLDGQIYELLQFHFHQPSEHLVWGQTFEMEAHFVHQNQITGEFVVLAVLMSKGEMNRALDTVWQKIPVQSDRPPETSDILINALDLLPENIDRYYRYRGSLTTPPCSEIVTWLVLKQPIEVSQLQIERFLSVIGTNARPVQALNNRILSESK